MQMIWIILITCVKNSFALNFSRVHGVGKRGATKVFLAKKT